MATRRIKGLKLRGEVWWWRGRIRGKRYWRSTGCKDFESAQRRALEIHRELRDIAFGWRLAASPRTPRADMPLCDELRALAAEMQVESRRHSVVMEAFVDRLAALLTKHDG